MPDSVEMPAPVSTTTRFASRNQPAISSMCVWGTVIAGENRTEDTSFVNLADGASQTFAAGQACSVTVQRSGNALTVLSVDTATGLVNPQNRILSTWPAFVARTGDIEGDGNTDVDPVTGKPISDRIICGDDSCSYYYAYLQGTSQASPHVAQEVAVAQCRHRATAAVTVAQ